MYGVVVDNKKDQDKAEQIIKKFSRRARVIHGHSVMFLYSGWPVLREVCMKCDRTGKCPITGKLCVADRVVDEALIGLRALLYSRVKAKLVFPAP